MPVSLTKVSAASVVRDWMENRLELPPARTQRRWLLNRFATLCSAEAIKRGENETHLELLLSEAEELLASIWYLTAPDIATKWWRENEKPTKEEEEIIAKAKGVIWTRRDPTRAYLEGFSSPNYFSCDKASLNATIAEYLSKPWVRDPFLDFIFMDMLITNEICSYGESMKERHYPSKNSNFHGIYNDRYFKAKGRLSEILKIDWNGKLEHLNMYFWWTVGFPLGAVWLAFHFDYLKAGGWLFGIWGGVWAIEIMFFLVRKFFRIIRWRSSQPSPHQRELQLWRSMANVWMLLVGPVVNPSIVRDAMRKATEIGAVWDNSAWAVIDRVILADPAVWIVEPR